MKVTPVSVLNVLGFRLCLVIQCFSSVRPYRFATLRKGNQSSEHRMNRGQVWLYLQLAVISGTSSG